MKANEILAAAKALPEKQNLEEYRETVEVLRDKGYTWREIAEFLNERGVSTDHTRLFRLFGKESPKTLEGAIAFAASTFIAARFVGVDIGTVKLAAACVATAACELVDDGVDNFVLPLYFAALVGL